MTITGNMAAMRKALEDFSRSLYNEALYCCTEKAMLGKYDNTQLSLCKSCVARGRECWQMTLAREAKTALSAPARNCDRFADAKTARQAWLDDTENWDEFGSPKLELHEWLFAPSEHKNDP